MAPHTESCITFSAAAAAARAAVLARWPKLCQRCGGVGGWMSGDSYESPPDYATCPDCLDRGKCPRCAAAVGEDGERCMGCGWLADDPNMVVLPLDPDREPCACEELLAGAPPDEPEPDAPGPGPAAPCSGCGKPRDLAAMRAVKAPDGSLMAFCVDCILTDDPRETALPLDPAAQYHIVGAQLLALARALNTFGHYPAEALLRDWLLRNDVQPLPTPEPGIEPLTPHGAIAIAYVPGEPGTVAQIDYARVGNRRARVIRGKHTGRYVATCHELRPGGPVMSRTYFSGSAAAACTVAEAWLTTGVWPDPARLLSGGKDAL